MNLWKQNFGKQGETLAVKLLLQKGYRLIEQNFRCRFGEIDIVALDGNTICFVEVKSRTSDWMGTPFEAISFFKQQKMIRAALYYLKLKNKEDGDLRFDVVGILFHQDGSYEAEVIPDAFGA